MHLLFYCCFLLLFLQSTEPNPELADCKTDYACFFSLGDRVGFIGPLSTPIGVDVLLKIHLYSQRHYRVILQSFKNDTKSITITRQVYIRGGNSEPTINWLSCEEESNEIVFKVENKKVEGSVNSKTLPLRCESEIKGKPEVLKQTLYAITLEADPKTKPEEIVRTVEFRKGFSEREFFCDPSKLIQNFDKADSFKAYTKVNVQANNFYCTKQYPSTDNGLWKFEYRKEGTPEYVKAAKPTCETVSEKYTKPNGKIGTNYLRKFVINGDKVDKAEVRCVADAKYFCDYAPPSPPGKKGLIIIDEPNRESNPPKASKLSCPPSHPYFVMGKYREKNTSFECRSSMKKHTWYFGNQPLPITGMKGYCSDTLECQEIPKERLTSISVKEKIPTCHEGGILKVKQDNQTWGEVGPFVCNKTDGKLYYTEDGSNQMIKWNQTLNVMCDYKSEEKAGEKPREGRLKIVFTSLGSGLAVVIVIAIVVIQIFKWRRRHKIEEKRECIEKRDLCAESESGTKSEIRTRKGKKKHDKNSFAKDNVTETTVALRTDQEDAMKAAILEDLKWEYLEDILPPSFNLQFREKEMKRLDKAMEDPTVIGLRSNLRENKAHELALLRKMSK